MDITKFINSETIAIHFLNNFRPEEHDDLSLRYAWLIWQSKNISIKEKIEAWQEIIDTFPDCKIRGEYLPDENNSLHQFLKEYIVCVQAVLEKFFRREETAKFINGFYWYEGHLDKTVEMEYDRKYTLFADCVWDLRYSLEDSVGILASHIAKIYDDGAKIVVTIKFDNLRKDDFSYKIVVVEELSEHDNQFKELNDVFKDMWFSFPLPFKPGDIVKLTYPKSEAFVLDSIYSKHSSFNNNDEYMQAYGYFVDWDGSVFYTGVTNYMDLEYYHYSMPKSKQILHTISEYLKGTVALDAVLSKYLAHYLSRQADYQTRYIERRKQNK